MRRLEGFMREHYAKHGASGWILKADVRKYFTSIDHGILKERLRRVIPDEKIMKLLETIIDSFNADTGKGIPMGNQTSQLFALYYLDPIDRLIKEFMRVKHYVRYMDDMALPHPSRYFLAECLERVRDLARHDLKLELNEKTQIFPLRNGVDFLGWHFYLTESGKVIKKLRRSSKSRLKRRLAELQREYAEGKAGSERVDRCFASINGHLEHGHTWRLRSALYGKTIFTRRDENEE
jgi:hypothetical protein